MVEFRVKAADVTEESSDLLLLKFAQNFYGADRAVASRLVSARVCREAEIQPRPGEFSMIETRGCIAPARVMFLGTPPLHSFLYNEMEIFACRAVEKIADVRLPVELLTTTVHGTGYGLDGGEALQRLVAGFQEGLSRHELTRLRLITFLTLDNRAERMLSTALADIASTRRATQGSALTMQRRRPQTVSSAPTPATEAESATGIPTAAPKPPADRKRRVFVALPFSEEFQNVYEFGIYPAVRNCGFICERVDETHFTGDVLTRIRGGIETADLVIADLTEGRPNVYLEVGYAWGKGVPVIFVAKKGEHLHFDVSSHRCVFYGKFTQFAKDLEELIRGINATPRDASARVGPEWH